METTETHPTTTIPPLNLPHVAARVFGSPLLIEPGKLEAIIAVLTPKLLGGKLEARAADSPARKLGLTVAGGVAVIPVMGTLVHRHDWLSAESGMTSYTDLAQQIATAAADPAVQGILLDLDSPGGEVSGCFDLADLVFAARAAKPVWAVANDMAASAAYAIGSAAERLFVTQSAVVGSIGVIMAHRDVSAANEKIGIKYTSIYAGARKADMSPHHPLSDEARASAQARVDSVYDIFVATVARNRGLAEKAVRDTEAGVYTGRGAVAAGLADEVATPAEAFRRLREHAAAPTTHTTTNPTKEKAMTNPTEEPAELPPATLQQFQPAAAVSEINLKPAADEAVAADRLRSDKILAAAAKLGVPLADARGYLAAGLSVEAALTQMTDHVAAHSLVKDIRASAPSPRPAADPDDSPEEAAKADWDADAKLRKEFAGNFDDYKAFRTHQAAGHIKLYAPALSH